MAADVASRAHEMHAMAPDVLRVTFVRIEGGMVKGELEPYVAPDCRCVVSTVFRGTIRGDTVDGSYVTLTETGRTHDGRWRVQRNPRTR